MPREDVAREERHDIAPRRLHRLAPEEVENRNHLTGCWITCLVVVADLRRYARFQLRERHLEFSLRDPGERLSDEKGAYGVDVAADSAGAKLEGFAQSRSAPHEGVEDDLTGQVVSLVEVSPDVRPFVLQSPECYSPKHRPQSRRPPLVNVVERPVDFLSPAFLLREFADLHDRETSFKGSCVSIRRFASQEGGLGHARLRSCVDMVTGLPAWLSRRYAAKRCSAAA